MFCMLIPGYAGSLKKEASVISGVQFYMPYVSHHITTPSEHSMTTDNVVSHTTTNN